MDPRLVLGGFLTAGLVAYLVLVLLFPERLS